MAFRELIGDNKVAFHGILEKEGTETTVTVISVVEQGLKLLCFAQISKHLPKYYVMF